MINDVFSQVLLTATIVVYWQDLSNGIARQIKYKFNVEIVHYWTYYYRYDPNTSISKGGNVSRKPIIRIGTNNLNHLGSGFWIFNIIG